MQLSINSFKTVPLTRLSRFEMQEIERELNVPDVPRPTLLHIGRTLLNATTNEREAQTIGILVNQLENDKPVKDKEVQNVFLDHVERALRHVGGRKSRSRKLKRKSRKSRKSRSSR